MIEVQIEPLVGITTDESVTQRLPTATEKDMKSLVKNNANVEPGTDIPANCRHKEGNLIGM